MSRYYLILLLFLLPFSSRGQDTLWFTMYGQPSAPDTAGFYRVITHERDTFFVKEFFKSGLPRLEATFLSLNPDIRTGYYVLYHPYGGISMECHYKNNILDGVQTSYDLYNNIIAKYLYKDGVVADTLVKEVDLNAVVNNGLSDAIVDTADVMPVFPGGEPAMKKYFKKAIRKPRIARKRKTRGEVVVRCIITHDGRVTDAWAEKGFGNAIDESVCKAILNMPRWIPGVKDGLKVHVNSVLTVKFPLKKK